MNAFPSLLGHHQVSFSCVLILPFFFLFQCMALAMTLAVMAEPPSGYSYSRPGGGGGYQGGLSGGGGGYTAVSSGYQTNEGAHVDPALLEQVRQILLKEEQSSSSHSVGGFGGGHGISSSYGAPSHSYGPPSSSYGVPGYGGGSVIGIDLEGIKQAIQVAQYHQASISHGGGGGGGGYSYHKPSGSYGAPF
ncbi:hypothetical protein RI129_001659 [Pyrocoelia pectoralis]|uniref:Uncharacterized protein n=1 Tax=Pyrocoelia pectoralis TaxID=417401 RepID=A0AAN7ZK52_9COLE